MMHQTLQVTLDDQLLSSLKQATEQAGVSIESIVTEWAERYVREQRSKKIRAETESYAAMHARLKKKYLGQHVAIHHGKLIDHDVNVHALIQRVQQRYGHTPIMFTLVEAAAEPELVIRSPRLEQAL